MTDQALQDHADAYDRHAATFTARVHGVVEDGWDAPAPVEGWRARDVVAHLDWIRSFLEHGSDVRLEPGPDPEVDPVGAWEELDRQLLALLHDPATADRTYDSPMLGVMPLGRAVHQFFTADVFMHTWDLARATGQDETLDPEMARELREGMESMPEEVLRGSGQFGPPQPAPEGADEGQRLMAFTGRRV
ncbi:maleylpyruvate isomerase family mycothiol-dependent enzyme [Ornithinimicrobium humiphilum]|uniref:Uncharacterized protein (TIGR03086 family) n=1 Tax=Ornithinimicrobium humiphilum TaxID=125288 RepID=A0A543KN81_9MICO|nr:TIGR03086 family metal-binding protein [Ornithinimicrobium humiphilum]TQM96533.1 uncharacterized protein (TIGR03086 family) [Ornithinimicrobium humiphilum]